MRRRTFIKQEMYYSLDYLNQQIAGLELGYMESPDRPSQIAPATLSNNDHKLKQEGKTQIILITKF